MLMTKLQRRAVLLDKIESIKDRLGRQEFKKGDRVRVMVYRPFKGHYTFLGTVTRDRTDPRPSPDSYSYSVELDDSTIERTEFDTQDMEPIDARQIDYP